MIKEAVIGVLIAGAGGSAVYLGDSRYIQISSYEQAVQQQREYQLIDQIQDIRDRAAYEHRALTDYEANRILQLEAEIRKLK